MVKNVDDAVLELEQVKKFKDSSLEVIGYILMDNPMGDQRKVNSQHKINKKRLLVYWANFLELKKEFPNSKYLEKSMNELDNKAKEFLPSEIYENIYKLN